MNEEEACRTLGGDNRRRMAWVVAGYAVAALVVFVWITWRWADGEMREVVTYLIPLNLLSLVVTWGVMLQVFRTDVDEARPATVRGREGRERVLLAVQDGPVLSWRGRGAKHLTEGQAVYVAPRARRDGEREAVGVGAVLDVVARVDGRPRVIRGRDGALAPGSRYAA